MTTAYVLSGGASLGAVQVGMVDALDEAGIRPKLIVGASVGAINGAWLAGGGDVAALADIWRGLRRRDLFPFSPIVGLRGLLGRSDHLVSNRGLRRVLRRHLAFERIEDAAIRLLVVATDATSGSEVVLGEGDAIDAILASAALPAVYPSVRIGDRTLIDGGVVNNTPITTAIAAGASEIYVLSTGYSCALPEPPTSALAMAMHSIALMVQRRLVLEMAAQGHPIPVHLVPAPCPISVTPIDFSQTDELIARAAAGTRQWLVDGRPGALPLPVPHPHDVV